MSRWVVVIELDEKTPTLEAEAFMDAVATVVHTFGPRTGWDPHMSASLQPAGAGLEASNG